MRHTTREGNTILISDMTDDHLKNTINMMCDNITKAYRIFSGDMKEDISTIAAGVNINMSKAKAKEIITNNTESLGAYVLEANIRGLDVTDKLREAFGRTTKTDIENQIMGSSYKLNAYEEEDDDYDYDDRIEPF